MNMEAYDDDDDDDDDDYDDDGDGDDDDDDDDADDDDDDDGDDDGDDEFFQESPFLGMHFEVKDMMFLPVLVPPDVVETVRSQHMPSNSHSLCMSWSLFYTTSADGIHGHDIFA